MATIKSAARRRFCLCCMVSSALAPADLSLGARKARADTMGADTMGANTVGIVQLIKSEAAKTPITVHRLRGGVSVLEGSGGNIAVLTGSDGKVLIDAGIGVSRPQMLTALGSLGDQPITHLINTHWHFDHSDGNAWVHDAGAEIMAHENTRKHLLMSQRVEDWDYDFPAPPAGALPSRVFASEQAVTLNGSTLALRHYGSAHTDSDISVRFTEADILHTGDTFWNGIYPFIDYSTGGHIDGMIMAAEANLATTTEHTIVVPGHGTPVSDRAGLQAYRDMLVGIRANVAGLKKQGHSLDSITASKPTAEFDAIWGQFVISPGLFTKLVYEGL